jgi:protein-tyrosine phosphatase
VALAASQRRPRDVTTADLAAASIIIALKEVEHRPLFEQHFPDWAGRARYWHIDDIDVAAPGAALPALERCIHDLILELSGAKR